MRGEFTVYRIVFGVGAQSLVGRHGRAQALMARSRIVKAPVGCVLISLCVALASPTTCHAMYAELHALLAYEASFVRDVPGELAAFSGDPSSCTSRTGDGLCNGAYDEDADRDPRLTSDPGSWIGLFGWGTHFWDPAGGPHGGRLMTVGTIPININGMNAYERALGLYQSALAVYPEDPPAAYYLLGRVAHLLADMATPAHVHLDPHVSDNHGTGDDSFEEFTAARYVRPDMWEGLRLLEADFPATALAALAASDLPDGGYPEEHRIFGLFLQMASLAAQYDSDDADGSVDRGAARGVSSAYALDRFLSAGIYGVDGEYPLPPFFYQLSPARKKFILPSAIHDTLGRYTGVQGLRLSFEEGTETHPLSSFTRTDIGDGDGTTMGLALIPAALRSVGSLYRLFWDEAHPSFALAAAPDIRLHGGLTHLEVTAPAPIELSLDLAPRGWEGVDTEVYVWASVAGSAGTARFYFDGAWRPFDRFSDLRPLAQSYRLEGLHDISWRALDDSAPLAGMTVTVAVCVDRAGDGRYSPASSVCGALPVAVQ